MSECRRERLGALSTLAARGLNRTWAALGIRVHRSTAWRWRRREAKGEPLARRRGPRTLPASPLASRDAAQLVEETHGLIGAEALRHSVPGLTRRAAAS